MNFSWYGLIIGLAIALFWWLFVSLLKQERKIKWSTQTESFAFLITLATALLGARIYHLLTNWELYAGNIQPWQIVATWRGGIGILGALIGGAFGLRIIARFWLKSSKTLNQTWLVALDSAALSLPLAQALGRLGNAVNQELFGRPTTFPWGIYIQPEFRPPEYSQWTHFHPLFAYEAISLLLLAAAMWKWRTKQPQLWKLGTGAATAWYLFGYGAIRFNLDFLRWQATLRFLTLSVSAWLSLIMIGLGIWLFVKTFRNQDIFIQ